MANNNAVRLYYFLRDLRYREHLALREQSADMLSVNQYLVQALERERDARRLSRQWAAAWKRAAKRWHALAYDNKLTTADMSHDAAIQRGDNCFTEHSRSLLRVGVLEGLLRRWHEYFYEYEQVSGAADLLIDETEAALEII